MSVKISDDTLLCDAPVAAFPGAARRGQSKFEECRGRESNAGSYYDHFQKAMWA